VVLERNVETGGGLATEELSGFKCNPHALYMLLAELMPPYEDLGLAQLGVAFVRPEVQAGFLFRGETLVLYADARRSVRAVGNVAPRDTQAFEDLVYDFRVASEDFLVPATYYPPVEPLEQVELLAHAGEVGSFLNELAELTPSEVIHSYGFEDERLEAALLYLATMFGLDPDAGGMGVLVPVYVHRLLNAALVVGGSHQLASGLRRVVEASGGTVVTGAPVREVLLEGERVAGVRLDDATAMRARAVVSTLNPVQTFLELIDTRSSWPELGEAATSWEWDEASLFVVNWGVVGPKPHYPGRPEDVDRALTVVMGVEGVGDVVGHFADAASGRPPDGRVGHGTVPSCFDRLAAARHLGQYGSTEVLRFECLAAYDADWEGLRRELAREAFATWKHHAPNLAEANVRVELPWSPRDIEAHLPTMRRGAIKHGAYVSIQMGYNRPTTSCSSYRTPIEGLYVAGASVHPGGMVLLAPGYNAARVVAEDLGLPVWWELPAMVSRAIARGYLPEPQVQRGGRASTEGS
jgi:phytoene dehydrogenase-like protein